MTIAHGYNYSALGALGGDNNHGNTINVPALRNDVHAAGRRAVLVRPVRRRGDRRGVRPALRIVPQEQQNATAELVAPLRGSNFLRGATVAAVVRYHGLKYQAFFTGVAVDLEERAANGVLGAM